MKIPRDLTGIELATALNGLGYEITRQRGSHIRLTTTTHGEHHITVPAHNPVKPGTLNGILADVAAHFSISKAEVIARIFDWQ